MHWLAIHCPTLPLDCILRRWPDGMAPALAVTDLDGSRRFIAIATHAAQSCGVFAGQAVATSLALLPDLTLVARNLEDERRALTEAALAALHFTPIVSLRESGLVMEISASLKLFGGRRVLKKDIVAAMRMQGLRIATAEAPTPHGAWLLAKNVAVREKPTRHESFAAALDALPIAHLESTRSDLDRFDGIGCHTLADLRRLPQKGLARRFGVALLDEMARASGAKPDPQIVFEAPSRFDARIELMARVESAEALVFGAQRLLAQLAGWLTARRAAVRGFTLVLHHDRWTKDAIAPTSIAIALATPASDAARLTALVRERLSRLELKAPVLELALAAPSIVDERESEGTLFPAREQATETLARLIEKLTARLGPDAMMRIERVADHRPERAWREVRGDMHTATAWLDGGPASKASASKASSTAGGSRRAKARGTVPRSKTNASQPISTFCVVGPRPSWLLSEPRMLDVPAHRPVFDSSLDL
ncbi:MAG: Y-family DNA polymerase, partial [Burkholderiaceae bacterium]